MKRSPTVVTLIGALTAALLGSGACASTAHPGKMRAAPARAPAPAVSSGYGAFGVSLYRELAAEKPGTNLFISPASVAFALGMTANGALGGTRDAMDRTLGRPAGDRARANAADSALIAGLNAKLSGVDLSIANSLWAREGLRFKTGFLDENRIFYGAEIRTLDFGDPSAPGTINGWVAKETRDRITKIVDQIDPSAILFLINAIYFKGTWTKQFDKALTADGPFHLAGGAEVTVPLMKQTGKYGYLEENGLQIVRLPYGDGRIGMYVFLPDSSARLERFGAGLTGEKLDGWISRLSERSGTIELPRFRLEYGASLKRSLSALGMAVAFDPGAADFRGMAAVGGANAYINDVRHKTFVEVNEEGTEAAAVTSVEIRLTSVMEPRVPPFRMIVDRPFFFVIRDGETGLMLFVGSIENPK